MDRLIIKFNFLFIIAACLIFSTADAKSIDQGTVTDSDFTDITDIIIGGGDIDTIDPGDVVIITDPADMVDPSGNGDSIGGGDVDLGDSIINAPLPPQLAGVPEPSTYLMLGSLLILVGAAKKRMKKDRIHS